ncbi:MAG TPA: hypothetical protein VGJ91_20030 [Polyangiaceae bacterium]|jgi:hypothetical protein
MARRKRRVLKAKRVTSGDFKGWWWLVLECNHTKFVNVYREGSHALCDACA